MDSINADSPPSTFERRIEKIQNLEAISNFVEKFKSGRTDIQISENYEQQQGPSQGPSTSSMGNNSKTARHHVIPGEVFRDAFLYMLSNQETWPHMAQMLNAALENLRHHKSSTKIEGKYIDIAQDALNMFDVRIPDCDFDFETKSFDEALEYLLAVFYWSPFNIYYGPLPYLRAPADSGNKRDGALYPGIRPLTIVTLEVMEDQLKKSDISVQMVKFYIINLFHYPTPRLAGSYRKISLSFDRYIENHIEYDYGLTPNSDEYNKQVSEIKNDKVTHEGKSLRSALLLLWKLELRDVGACDRCKTYAQDSLDKAADKNYKCKQKKCPFFSAQAKYALHSYVNHISRRNVRTMLRDLAQCYSSIDFDKEEHLIPEKVAAVDTESVISAITGNRNLLEEMCNPDVAILMNFNFSTDNNKYYDYEYKRLKEIKMKKIPATIGELYKHPLRLETDDILQKI